MVLVLSHFGVLWVLPCSIKELLLGCHGNFVEKSRKRFSRTTPLFVLVWREHNRGCF